MEKIRRSMETARLKDMLTGTAHEMLELADRLGKGEEPLSNYEKSLLKTACLPAVKEQLDLALLDYLIGREVKIDLSPYTID